MRTRAAFAIVALALLLVTFDGTQGVAESVWKLVDVHAREHAPFARKKTKAIVLVFITTDCPIANYYQPTLSKLTAEYAKKEVPFFLVHSDRDTRAKAAIQHAQEFKSKAPVVLDAHQALAKRLDARVTPEAFLIDSQGRTRYRGRIDDLYADFGKRRRIPKSNDLRDAIDALLAGKEIAKTKTKAVGCYIAYPKK